MSHDALAPAGPQAARIGALLGAYTWVSVAVLVVVLAFTLWAILRRRPGSAAVEVELPPSTRGELVPERRVAAPDPARERRLATGVAIATVATFAVLLVLLVLSIVAGRALSRFGGEGALTVRIVGHQWWWEVQYLDPQPALAAVTANELHVPVGKPVRLKLQSRDVIHSFWVPSLHGKADLIPGKETQLVLQADAPGTYRGQCAEFCGLGHAKMAIVVVAEDEESFQAWLARQREPARAPVTAEERRGGEVFLRSSCAMCHRVLGTDALATNGPDLTHVAGRLTLGAGTLPRTRGHLAGWILNPSSSKPGVNMPPTSLPPEDLHALLSYLETLR